MEQKVEYLTAESESGRSAIEEVMEHSYKTHMRDVPLVGKPRFQLSASSRSRLNADS